MIENSDGTITVTKEEVFEEDALNRRLSDLEIRVRALRADPSCTSRVDEVEWGDVHPRIVTENGPGPGVTIRPNAIPSNHTLVLAAERTPRHPSRPPNILMRLMLVRGPAPPCVGEFFTRPDPLERFTARAREIVPQAREEARELGHRNVGPEHILLALLRDRESLAAQVLNSLDITIERVRGRVVQIAGPIKELPSPQIPLRAPFTPRGMRVLELATTEATSIGADQVGAEHILLGLVREHDGVAARVLREHDADPEKVRNELIRHSRPEEPPGGSAER